MTEILTFEQALGASERITGNCHLLLGNGFSIACRDSFSYGKLFDEADFSDLTIDAGPLFEIFGTADFERAIDALRVSAGILDLYDDSDGGTVERLRQDANALKEALTEVLARKHPDNFKEIDDEEYQRDRR